MLSIIIPTLNEEDYLPFLLESVKRQKFDENYEIIVADAGSRDKTIEIAEKYGCKTVSGGLPAKGRNEGEKIAKGALILFLDADTILPENFLKENLENFKKRNLGVAIFFQNPQTKNKFFSFLFRFFYNWLSLLFSKISLFGGVGILVKKSVLERVGGFDETIKISEDVFFLQKACRIAKFGILRKIELSISTRRYEKEGWLKTFVRHFLAGFYTTFFGPIKSDVFKYKFGHHKNQK